MNHLIVFGLWALAFVVHALIAWGFVPPKFWARYKAAPKDAEYTSLGICYYAIPILNLIFPDLPLTGSILLGGMVYLTGSALTVWAMRVNPFFLPTIVEPPVIVYGGPYSLFRHPGYIGLGMMAFGMAAGLGQKFGVIPCSAYIAILVWRGMRESDLLYKKG